MGNKMIYIRKSDEPFWARLEEIAKRRGEDFSPYLAGLVRSHVYSQGTQTQPVESPLDELEALQKRCQAIVAQLREA